MLGHGLQSCTVLQRSTAHFIPFIQIRVGKSKTVKITRTLARYISIIPWFTVMRCRISCARRILFCGSGVALQGRQ